MKKLLAVIVAVAMSASASAENTAIVGGKVFTQTNQGILESATVLIKDGKIERITEGNTVPDGYTKVDATGKVVTPGLVGALTSLGLVEVSSWAGLVDASVETTPISSTGAAMDVSYAINPDSTLIGVSRLEGVTSAATTMESTEQLFHGLGAVISLNDNTDILKSKAFMVVNVGGDGAEETGGSRAALWVTLEQVLSEVTSVKNIPGPGSEWHGLTTRADLAALKGVVAGDIPLFMQADRAADIRQIIAFKKRHPSINIVLLHGVEAWRVADELAANDIPVIIDPQLNLPGNFEQLGATLANAGRLEAAGVTIAIGMETHNIRLATQHAGNAVANGLSHEAGIASLTSGPAKILGLEKQVGTLAPGKRADVVIWSGDPLEVTEVAEQVYINGKAIDMTSRQTKLRERYQTLQMQGGSMPSHYIRK
ncbi:amidohydrolase family protein [Alteromonas pelagimontana]|uniref:Amidohydrolase family protein n=1 Tax=Alteromonas pelagimontana TaxID=1858656 RepID=A0A6M4M9Y7_9ALTE|nr:amidohydrolase family protein [Alteromonas pelagimontana]QJR79779.1 amidohydrolase family protein [Alteromonas pelagimontana]